MRGGEVEVLRPGSDLGLDAAFLPEPEFVTFPTSDGDVAHGLYYAPAHPDAELPAGRTTATDGVRPRRPDGIGPATARAGSGPPVLDEPRGRRDRRRLPGEHRLRADLPAQAARELVRVDVDDAVAAADYLAERGDVDGDRLMIQGGSSGGTIVLLALALHDVFAAGTNLFGVTDMVALMTRRPQVRVAVRRSADGAVARGRRRVRPTIADQPPRAAVVAAARAAGNRRHGGAAGPLRADRRGDAGERVSRSATEFEGEGHGFRPAEKIVRWFESELWFYGRCWVSSRRTTSRVPDREPRLGRPLRSVGTCHTVRHGTAEASRRCAIAEKIEWMIETNGWALEADPARRRHRSADPGYAYSIGMPDAVGFPDVAVFGLTPAAANGLDHAGRRCVPWRNRDPVRRRAGRSARQRAALRVRSDRPRTVGAVLRHRRCVVPRRGRSRWCS